MPQRSPRILITASTHGSALLSAGSFVQLLRSGGKPILVDPTQSPSIPAFDGLVLSGGADVEAWRYGAEEPSRAVSSPILLKLRKAFGLSPHTGHTDPARDELELKLIGEAMREGKPILGICRGMQLLNVAFGGTLHQNIQPFYNSLPRYHSIRAVKPVRLAPDSRLAGVLGQREFRVNSLHSQAVKDLASPFVDVAWEISGLVQAMESRDVSARVFAVQWHPELLLWSGLQRQLFAWLVREAARS